MASKRRELERVAKQLESRLAEWNLRLSAVSHWDQERPALEVARDATEAALARIGQERRRLEHVL